MRIQSAILTAIVLLMSGLSQANELAGTKWNLIDDPVKGSLPDLTFDEKHFSWYDGCEGNGGEYKIEGNQIVITAPGSRAGSGCARYGDWDKTEYNRLRDGWSADPDTFERSGNMLTINGVLKYTLIPTDPPNENLYGTQWKSPISPITLNFVKPDKPEDRPRIEGWDGCFNYSVEYQSRKGKFEFYNHEVNSAECDDKNMEIKRKMFHNHFTEMNPSLNFTAQSVLLGSEVYYPLSENE